MPNPTLVILNPYAGGGRAGKLWENIEPYMRERLGELEVAITPNSTVIPETIAQAQADGIQRVVAIGGDGTGHSIINALAEQAENGSPMTLGFVPGGTGQDFARFTDIPLQAEAAIELLAQTEPRPVDVGYLEYDSAACYFMNIASAGLSGEVARRVNRSQTRRLWSFWLNTVGTFLSFSPVAVQIRLDGEDWYEGDIWLAAVANGAIFGRGMMIAPEANIHDGWFDVVVVKGSSRLRAITAMNTVYSGGHLRLPEVLSQKAKQVDINVQGEKIPLDFDGEDGYGRHLRFTIRPGVLPLIYGR